MKEILFRAKTSSEVNGFNRKKDGLWVYGFYRDKVGLPTISEFDTSVADYIDYEVDRRTICQFTGLTDKNGTKIFEGDIVRGKDYGGLRREGVVEYDKYTAGYNIVPKTKSEYRECSIITSLSPAEEYLEIIGNIYDNYYLLRGYDVKD